jgi:hypothetical protein
VEDNGLASLRSNNMVTRTTLKPSPCSRVLFEKTFPQLVKKFTAIYTNRRFITLFINAMVPVLFQTNPVHTAIDYFFTILLNVISPLCLDHFRFSETNQNSPSPNLQQMMQISATVKCVMDIKQEKS